MYDQQSIESYLWESANILRGSIDAADFKTYIFPLLFYKRISDVYDEETEIALQESNGNVEYASFPENHRFQVPEECHWSDIRQKSENIGHALKVSMRLIEQANPDTLYGIFGDVPWTNKERFSDSLLKDLIEHFSTKTLNNANCQNDVLGGAYEFLIKKFADLTNKKAGEFYTPRNVIKLLVKILNPKPGESVYDPACGTGGMLLETLHHIREAGSNDKLMLGKLYGQEKNLTTSTIARMNLYLHGSEDFTIAQGDTLRNPAFFSGDTLAQYDCVIANPPFSLKNWGDDIWVNDPYGRCIAGLPPSNNGDYAWIQHMIKSMATKTGRMAVVLPHGVLFRPGKERAIRQRIIEMDILEAIIGLGSNLFYGATIAACILIFRYDKSKELKGSIKIIDASDQIKVGRAQNELLPEHIDNIYRQYVCNTELISKTRIVPIAEVRMNDFNLNISKYTETQSSESSISIYEAMSNISKSIEQINKANTQLINLLELEGLL